MIDNIEFNKGIYFSYQFGKVVECEVSFCIGDNCKIITLDGNERMAEKEKLFETKDCLLNYLIEKKIGLNLQKFLEIERIKRSDWKTKENYEVDKILEIIKKNNLIKEKLTLNSSQKPCHKSFDEYGYHC